jgi:hypothetical protein
MPARAVTREQAIRQVMKARDLNEDQAEMILSRTLAPYGDEFRCGFIIRLFSSFTSTFILKYKQ